jgi:hypothetical protein
MTVEHGESGSPPGPREADTPTERGRDVQQVPVPQVTEEFTPQDRGTPLPVPPASRLGRLGRAMAVAVRRAIRVRKGTLAQRRAGRRARAIGVVGSVLGLALLLALLLASMAYYWWLPGIGK